MSASAGGVSFTITAIDEASATISQVQTNLDGLTTSAGGTTEGAGGALAGAGDAADEASVSMTQTASSVANAAASFGGLAYQALTTEKAHTMLERAQLLVQTQTEAVTKATDAYNTAVAKYGPNSTEAATAAQKLSDAQNRLAIDQQSVSDKTDMYNLRLTMLATTAVPQVITGITGLQTAYGNVTKYISQHQTALDADATSESTAATNADTLAGAEDAAGGSAATAAGEVDTLTGSEDAAGTSAVTAAGEEGTLAGAEDAVQVSADAAAVSVGALVGVLAAVGSVVAFGAAALYTQAQQQKSYSQQLGLTTDESKLLTTAFDQSGMSQAAFMKGVQDGTVSLAAWGDAGVALQTKIQAMGSSVVATAQQTTAGVAQAAKAMTDGVNSTIQTGLLTDAQGKVVSFKDCVTNNLSEMSANSQAIMDEMSKYVLAATQTALDSLNQVTAYQASLPAGAVSAPGATALSLGATGTLSSSAQALLQNMIQSGYSPDYASQYVTQSHGMYPAANTPTTPSTPAPAQPTTVQVNNTINLDSQPIATVIQTKLASKLRYMQ